MYFILFLMYTRIDLLYLKPRYLSLHQIQPDIHRLSILLLVFQMAHLKKALSKMDQNLKLQISC